MPIDSMFHPVDTGHTDTTAPGWTAIPGHPDDTNNAPREAQQHPDMVQLFGRLDQALADRDHWRKQASGLRALVEAGEEALRLSRSEAAAALAIAERAQRERDEARNVTRRVLMEREHLRQQRDEARTWARRLYADKLECEHTIRVLVAQVGASANQYHYGPAYTKVYTVTPDWGYDAPHDATPSAHNECPHCGVCLDCGATGANVYTDDDPGACSDCGLPLECVRPGKVQCQECVPCQRCGHVTHDGVCSGGCYPRDYSEQP